MKVYKSHHDDVEIPNVDVLTLLFDSDYCAAQEDTKIHVEAASPNNSITKAEARDVVRRVARVLRDRYSIGANGAGQDVVVSTSSGSPFVPVLFYSIVAAGGVYSGASTAFKTNELVRQVKDADAKLLICSPEYEEHTIKAAQACGIPLDRILIADSSQPHDWKLSSLTDRSNLLDYYNGPMLEWRRLTDRAELENTTACLLYSSGTTGLPKGVRISTFNLVAACVCGMHLAQGFRDRLKREGKPFNFSMIAHLPTAHIGGITWSSLCPFYLGGTAYWIKSYEFESFIEYHRKYRLTALWTVPPIWLAIARSPQVTDHFDSIQIACSGAAPMGAELTKEVTRKIGKGQIPIVSQLWGATETTGSISGIDFGENDTTCSSGAPFPNLRVRFIDENDQDVEPGQLGEILVSGPLICQGYHNRPEANANSFLDGFYRTGDLGIWKNGLIYVVDRLKELIKYKGLQVAPAELEALLVTYPAVSDAAVIGIKEEATEVPRAFIVPQPRQSVTEEMIVDFVKENVANHKRLRGGVVFVDEIPKSASGKILRKELRQKYGDGVVKAKL